MAVKPTFCSICNRAVYVAHPDPLSCPVCSSPLLEPAGHGADEVAR